MSGSRVVMILAIALMVGGCASGRTRQDFTRLQSQVGLLDERVTQLERSGVGGFSSSATSSGATGFEAGTSSVGASGAAPAERPHAITVSIKPSTRAIQQALKNAGLYQGAVDGKMGAQTRGAIKEFQRVNGLHADGVVGRQTWAKLSAYTNLSPNGGEATAAEALK